MANSVLDAIKQGVLDYEPHPIGRDGFASTAALPGTDEKLAMLVERVRQGLPLWHPGDQLGYEDRQ